MKFELGEKILMCVEFDGYSPHSNSALICIDNGKYKREFLVDRDTLTNKKEIMHEARVELLAELEEFKAELEANQTEDNFNQGITFGLNLAIRTLKESMKEKTTN